MNIPVSANKVKKVKQQKKSSPIEGYRLVDMELIQYLITSLACPECHEKTLVVEEDKFKKKGLASFIIVSCSNCFYESSSFTSKGVQPLDEETREMKPFEVNIRSVYAFRSCGVGHTGIEKFCGMMNMPSPMTGVNYAKMSCNIRDAVKIVAEKSMKDAVEEAKLYKRCSRYRCIR